MSKKELLRALEAHGQNFLQSFGSVPVLGKRKDSRLQGSSKGSKKARIIESCEPELREEDSGEEEWTGFANSGSDSEGSSVDGLDDEGEHEEDYDDDFTSESHARQPNVVVFSETKPTTAPLKSKSGFMSSKVSKLRDDGSTLDNSKRTKAEGADGDDDLSNAQNDALLHRLVHTKLLSGSLNPDLELTHAHRTKALAGRVLEATGKVKLGKGERTVRLAEHNRAAKHVREGIAAKRKERQKQELEEAKNLGNYHPTMKALFEASSTGSGRDKKRDKGLKMGVGSFKGGILRLSRDEIRSAEGIGASRGGRGGRGGRAGRGSGRGRGSKRTTGKH